MGKISICLVALLFLFNFAHGEFKAPDLNDTRIIVTGYAQTNIWRNVHYPVFTDETGRQMEVQLTSEPVAEKWEKLVKGRAHVTLIGTIKENALQVASVEKFKGTDEDLESSIEVLRFDASRAWSTTYKEMSAHDSSSEEVIRRHSVGPGLVHLLTSNLVYKEIEFTHDADFLRSVKAMGELARFGIPAEHVSAFQSTANELLSISEPENVKKLKARLRGRESKCDVYLTGVERTNTFEAAISTLRENLKR